MLVPVRHADSGPPDSLAANAESTETSMKIEDHIDLLQSALDAHDRDILLNWRHKVSILSENLRQAAAALEKARPSVKARAIEAADADKYDDLVGEIEQVLSRIRDLNLL